ncbi:MAG: hypothetical protein IJY61_07005 [Candidatus Gastranaerophilales bacterium]|nr:hypothetical protein [Candidatus Gastranaerophilales bacterium]
MKKTFFTLTIFAYVLFSMVQSANAYVEEVSTKPYVDKFKPSTGVKIQESNLAARMENATREAAYGGAKEEKQWARKRTTPRNNENNSNVRSYKWF